MSVGVVLRRRHRVGEQLLQSVLHQTASGRSTPAAFDFSHGRVRLYNRDSHQDVGEQKGQSCPMRSGRMPGIDRFHLDADGMSRSGLGLV